MPSKYASAIAANVAVETLVKSLIASGMVDKHKFDQALAAAMRRLNQSGDADRQEAAKALRALYWE